MFYSNYILAKKGPLGKVWLAAHFEKRLSKSQVFTTDITYTVDSIIHPTEPLSLRLSGQLMLGLVRIFSKKINYFYVDAKDIIWKIELAAKPGLIHPGKVDIDKRHQEMNVDDTKFYGNVSAEMEYPILENLAFVSPLLPGGLRRELAMPMPVSAGQIVGELSYMDSAASIEFVRYDDRPSILSAGRASYAIEGKKPSSVLGSASRYDEMLPVFEEKADFSLFEETQLMGGIVTPIGLEMPLPAIEVPTPTPMIAETPTPEIAIVPTVSPLAEEVETRIVKRRKLDERIQLSEGYLQQSLLNTSMITRRRTADPLPFAAGLTVEDVLSPIRDLEERVLGHHYFCPELRVIAEMAAELRSYPFPTRELPPIVSPPPEPAAPTETARRGRRRETMIPTPESEPIAGRVSEVEMFEPMMPEIPFEIPEEMKALELGGRPSLFKKFTEEEERKIPIAGSTEWIRSIDSYVTQNATEQGRVKFSDLCQGGDRKFAARCFMEVLQLKSLRKINVKQTEAYGEIEILSIE